MGEKEKFDLVFVSEQFTCSIKTSEDDVFLESYLVAFREILKFFSLMGSIFGFVSSDVKSKIEILEELRENNEDSDKFESVKKMMNHERENDLLQKRDYVSGSRTLLRLHRGLDFLRVFMRRLGEIDGCDKTSPICSQSYNDTLANFHPFLIRKAAGLAMYALPTRDELLEKVCSDINQSIETLPEMLRLIDIVYVRVHDLYTLYDLHGLP